jgi:hypothetical protein
MYGLLAGHKKIIPSNPPGVNHRSTPVAITLSEAKGLAYISKEILRFAQNDLA